MGNLHIRMQKITPSVSNWHNPASCVTQMHVAAGHAAAMHTADYLKPS